MDNIKYVPFEEALKAMKEGRIVQWDRNIYWIDKTTMEIVSTVTGKAKNIHNILLSNQWIITDRFTK
jgi:hypothetical protein